MLRAGNQVRYFPQASSDASSHSGRHPQRAGNLDEVVREVPESDGCRMVVNLPAEGIC
jgi:hypothetical protein